MPINYKKNEKYSEWLEKNNLEENLFLDGAVLVCSKDNRPLWKDDEGHEFTAYSCQHIFEAGMKEAQPFTQAELALILSYIGPKQVKDPDYHEKLYDKIMSLLK